MVQVSVGWRSFSFLRLSFPRGNLSGAPALAELTVWGDTPSVVEMVDMVSRALPSTIACGGGLPLNSTGPDGGGSFVECAGTLARLQVGGAAVCTRGREGGRAPCRHTIHGLAATRVLCVCYALDPTGGLALQTSDKTGNVTGIPGGLLFDASNDRLAGVVMEFHTNVSQGLVASWQYSLIHPSFVSWEGFLNERLAMAPPSAKTAWLVNLAYLASETQTALQRATYQSGMLALVLAFGVLLAATRNLVVSSLSTVAIAVILAWTMGTVVWMGWRLGVMESTNIAILIGISVDFVVHFAHAYLHGEEHGQEARGEYCTV
jgi:hypothetical protein